jgi:hypothetical protein
MRIAGHPLSIDGIPIKTKPMPPVEDCWHLFETDHFKAVGLIGAL